jgi:hypothetical protein
MEYERVQMEVLVEEFKKSLTRIGIKKTVSPNPKP